MPTSPKLPSQQQRRSNEISANSGIHYIRWDWQGSKRRRAHRKNTDTSTGSCSQSNYPTSPTFPLSMLTKPHGNQPKTLIINGNLLFPCICPGTLVGKRKMEASTTYLGTNTINPTTARITSISTTISQSIY